MYFSLHMYMLGTLINPLYFPGTEGPGISLRPHLQEVSLLCLPTGSVQVHHRAPYQQGMHILVRFILHTVGYLQSL